MIKPISITGLASISALGSTPEHIWQQYLSEAHHITKHQYDGGSAFVAQLTEADKDEIEKLRHSDSKYKFLDDAVLYGIYVSRKAISGANWQSSDDFGVNFGSSRGATTLFESYYKAFLKEKFAETLSSPTTTLGNISSWIAHDLQTQGPTVSHSITCSTGLHALLNGVAWLTSGMTNKFLVGASEAALTEFTIAQMQALKVYARHDAEYPCQALNLTKKQNTMVVGEGAAALCLENGLVENALATIEGIGYATEILEHNVSISAEAKCFQKSMKMALGTTAPEDVDVIVMHAPGTIKGDRSEVNAIQKIFGNHQPLLTSNKWKLGHTFATSGLLSVELAIMMLQHQKFIAVPFVGQQTSKLPLQKILVNAVGFGGNAVSVLLSK